RADRGFIGGPSVLAAGWVSQRGTRGSPMDRLGGGSAIRARGRYAWRDGATRLALQSLKPRVTRFRAALEREHSTAIPRPSVLQHCAHPYDISLQTRHSSMLVIDIPIRHLHHLRCWLHVGIIDAGVDRAQPGA